MSRLLLARTGAPWCTGAARCYFEHSVLGPASSALAVRCILGARLFELALLDTASTFSIIAGATADKLGHEIDDTGVATSIWSRFGRLDGHVCRLGIRLAADPEWGIDLDVDATVLVLPTWPGPTVLGVRGFLDRVRIAVDPGSRGDHAMFFFGETG